MVGEKTDKQLKALEMHLLGRKLVDISRVLNIPLPTLKRWKSQYNWEVDMDKAKKKTEADMEQSMITIRSGILKASSQIFMEGYKTYIQDLQNGRSISLKPTELVSLGNLIETMTRPQRTVEVENPEGMISVDDVLKAVEDFRKEEEKNKRDS